MIRFKRISETTDMKVFVETGDYFGEIEEALITHRKVAAWKIRATKNSTLERIFRSGGGVSGKGVIVPHNLIKAVGDIIIISKAAIPSYAQDDAE
jgi:sporulation protein YlmC with PRC-barrel domain